MNKLEIILGGIGALILVVLVFTLPTYFLWNWLMPDLFNLPYINFWQALGINFLSSILFKSYNINSKE
mgnify:FL=1